MNASKVQVNTAKLEALINVICQEDKSAYKYFIDQINRHVMIHSSVSFNKLLFACYETITFNQDATELFDLLIEALLALYHQHGSVFVMQFYSFLKQKYEELNSSALPSLTASKFQPTLLGASACHRDLLARFLKIEAQERRQRGEAKVLRIECAQLYAAYRNVCMAKYSEYRQLSQQRDGLVDRRGKLMASMRERLGQRDGMLKFDEIDMRSRLTFLERRASRARPERLAYSQFRRQYAKAMPADRIASLQSFLEDITRRLCKGRALLERLRAIDFRAGAYGVLVKRTNHAKLVLRGLVAWRKFMLLVELRWDRTRQLAPMVCCRGGILCALVASMRRYVLRWRVRAVRTAYARVHHDLRRRIGVSAIIRLSAAQAAVAQLYGRYAERYQTARYLQTRLAHLGGSQRARLALARLRLRFAREALWRSLAALTGQWRGIALKALRCRWLAARCSAARSRLAAARTPAVPYYAAAQLARVKCLRVRETRLLARALHLRVSIRTQFAASVYKQKTLQQLSRKCAALHRRLHPPSSLSSRLTRVHSAYVCCQMRLIIAKQVQSERSMAAGELQAQVGGYTEKYCCYSRLRYQRWRATVYRMHGTVQHVSKLMRVRAILGCAAISKILAFTHCKLLCRTLYTYLCGLLLRKVRITARLSDTRTQTALRLRRLMADQSVCELETKFLCALRKCPEKHAAHLPQLVYRLVTAPEHAEMRRTDWQQFFTGLVRHCKLLLQLRVVHERLRSVTTSKQFDQMLVDTFQRSYNVRDKHVFTLVRALTILAITGCQFGVSRELLFPAIFADGACLLRGVTLSDIHF